MEACTFSAVPDGGLFIEIVGEEREIDPFQFHDVYEKCGDHELVFVGSIKDGVVYLDAQRGEPTPDHINGRARVVYVSRNRVQRAAA